MHTCRAKMGLLLLLFSLIEISSAIGQGCCSGGTPLTGNLDLSASVPGMIELRGIYDYNNLGDVVFENQELDDKTRLRTTHAALLRVQYSPDDKWAFAVMLPYVSQIETIKTSNPTTSTSGTGIGDIVLLVQRNILNKDGYNWSLAIGGKAPTGPISRTSPITELLLHPDLQPGTGAWDFLAVTQFSRTDFIFPGVDLQAAFNYRYANPADRFNGLQQYQFGNEFQVNAGMNYRFFTGGGQWISQLLFRYRHTQVDRVDEFAAINTGGEWGYLIPGLNYMPSPQWGVGVSGQIPVFRQLTGIQLTTSYRITGTVFYRFSLNDEADLTTISF